MGTELTIYDRAQFVALTDASDAAEALATNLRGEIGEIDLIHVPTPAGGGLKWVIPGIEGEEITDEIVGLLVYYGSRGVLWPRTNATEGTSPLLLTTDLAKARRIGDDYGDIDPDELAKYRIASLPGEWYDWQRLPWNQWGSGNGGVGKRCKESRILCILRENEVLPLVVRAQPGSLKTVRPFVVRLMVPHYRAVVSLRLQNSTSKSGVKYSQIAPRLIGAIDRNAGARIKEMYTDVLSRLFEGVTEFDVQPDTEPPVV